MTMDRKDGFQGSPPIHAGYGIRPGVSQTALRFLLSRIHSCRRVGGGRLRRAVSILAMAWVASLCQGVLEPFDSTAATTDEGQADARFSMWLDPPESDPPVDVYSEATYSVTFRGLWTTAVTSGGLPGGAHFTRLIGGVHNAGVTFLRDGGRATRGVEFMAELGGTSTLASEVRAAGPNALAVLLGSGNIGPTGSSSIDGVTLTTDHSRVTLLAMIAPSPDWFVGVSGLSLLDEQGEWRASLAVNLYPWDAGTEEGAEFSLSNPDTRPQGVITSIRGRGRFSNEPIATLTFTLLGIAAEEPGDDPETASLFVPVILSSAGRNQSFFTSELTLTNRGEEEVKLDFTYTAKAGGGSGAASDRLPAGRQKIATDALAYLAGLGIPIPGTGNRSGTLRVEFPLGGEVEAVVRTTTPAPDGRAGLAYPGVSEEEGFSRPVYLCGLRQNSRDRSNVAFQNMGAVGEGAITLRTTVYSGEAGDSEPRVLEHVRLGPGGFHQYSGLLGGVENGYVKVERVEGEAHFHAYGVINDQANSDGSFVFAVTAGSLDGKMAQTLPVIVETRDFTSELTVTNFSQEPRTLNFEFVSEQIQGDDKTVGFRMELKAGEQEIIPELVEVLRREEMAKLGASRGFYLGPLFVTAEEGDLSGVVIGARTSSQGGGGQYGVYYNAVPAGEAFSKEAWVEGLQQNEENRSNLALVNTGEVNDSPSVFHLEIYNGETGMLEETVVTRPIPARGWQQIDGILLRASSETRQGYVRIEKVSGENPFLAYGVVNDGGAPGERSGDGAYLPARE